MFKRKKNIEEDSLTFVEGNGSQPHPARAAKPIGQVNKTVIGEHIVIEGNIRGEEHLLIEGTMKGNVQMPSHNLHVGLSGRFEGEIQALNVNVAGRMTGKIKSQERVVITKDAKFNGEIKTKTISLEDGAYFKGNIELEQEQPHKATPPKTQDNQTVQKPNPQKSAATKKLAKSG